MKTIVPFLLFAALLLYSKASFAQSVVSSETFPNGFNAGNNPGTDGNFSGNQGNWSVVASSNFSIEVDGEEFVSSPRALGFKISSSSASSGNSATSPTVDLNFGNCQPSSATFSFSLLPEDVDNGNSNFALSLEFYNGTSWSSVWSRTSDQMYDTYGRGNWRVISINLPASYWLSQFKYRFVATKTNTSSGNYNSTEVWIDNVEIATVTTGPSFPNFSATPVKITDGGNAGGGYEVGDVYRYANIVSVPFNINAEVKIEAIVNARVDQLDNNAAGIAQRFQPLISPNSTLNSDREGYVQFAITFKKASDNSIVSLNGLRYRHFDIDGNSSNNHTFRETGWITGHTSVLVNNPSDLSDGGIVNDGGYSWKKALGELDEHDGVSSDADVYFTATYGAVSTIRLRLGYVFDEIRGNVNQGTPVREYGTEFGCFSIQENVPLPLTLLNFNGSYKNNKATLNWATADEKNVDRFEVERSADGSKFFKTGTHAAKGVNGAVTSYQLIDDLSNTSGNLFYYRLKSIDLDGTFTYSKVLTLRKGEKAINEISVVPNPVLNSNAVIKISSTEKAVADLKIVDFSGRIVKSQKLNLYDGVNTIPIHDAVKLSAGIYTVQLIKGKEVFSSKFIIRQ